MEELEYSPHSRPWRKVGLGICAVVAVMFVVGNYVFDVATAVRNPILFTTYWLVMMGLIGWLCFLAIRDVVYTRRMIATWKLHRDAKTRDSRIKDFE